MTSGMGGLAFKQTERETHTSKTTDIYLLQRWDDSTYSTGF
jgi:hypothetical protein